MAKDKCITCIVPAPLINQVWNEVEPILELVAERAPDDIDLESINKRLIDECLMLVVIIQNDKIIGANILDAATLDSGKKVLVVQITAGTKLDLWIDQTLDLFKEIAENYECTALRCIGVRDGWIRMLKPHGWNQLFVTMQCELKKEE